ncbi:glycosyltransferase family 4 protein [Corynebacterium auris]|uniref:glycosyltransferase family 4 protein n=1 Tax=Corynebacterium auris TaxID=44750 RepID=UPI0025B2AD7A|nr:glycosyltransferase family 4 protein [Corynebacterium auris]WJY68421.1 GDP-mannose-dependent alpha-(1-6)-phosphatidylinositol monomannoside mannosyltransferase [Corynebacterium auris]
MRTLLVTNDFPPTVGGIQSYLRDYAAALVERAGQDGLVVFASTQDAEAARLWDAACGYEVIRWPRSVMLPTPAVRREMQRIIRERDIDTVWFGAAAPLALLGAAAREAGASRVVATTHGHEVGWSMLPGARQALRRIGDRADVVTYISRYTLSRFGRALGPHPRFVAVPSALDTDFFRPIPPDRIAAARAELGVGRAPLVVCASRLVARKGQDQLIRALPRIRSLVDGTHLAIVGSGPYGRRLHRLAEQLAPEHRAAVTFTGAVDSERLRDVIAAADVFAMPARTRGWGLDTEGLGIVYLEAQACGVPVVAGDSGGAPEAVGPDSGVVVNGRDTAALADAVASLLGYEARRVKMGEAGPGFVEKHFGRGELGDRLFRVINGEE